MVAVGGLNLVDVISKITNGINYYLWFLAGGNVIINWLIIQMMLINTFHFMLFIYLLIGVFITAISLGTKTQHQKNLNPISFYVPLYVCSGSYPSWYHSPK